MPESEVRYYALVQLTYGLRSAATLARLGLELITDHGEEHCEDCEGKYSVNDEKKLKLPRCDGVAHKLAAAIKKGYVDDLIFNGPTRAAVKHIAHYGSRLLAKFSYRFKGLDVSGDAYDPASVTLDADRRMLVCGLRYRPEDDTFSQAAIVTHWRQVAREGSCHQGEA